MKNLNIFLDSISSEDLLDVYEHIMTMTMVTVMCDEGKVQTKNRHLKRKFIDSVFNEVRQKIKIVYNEETLNEVTESFKEKYSGARHVIESIISISKKEDQ